MRGVILAVLVGCATEAPDATARYREAMLPLLVENAEMSRDFQDLAARVKKERPPAEAVARVLEERVVPRARELAHEVQRVAPEDPRLSEAHDRLVEAWTDRAAAFEDMLAAWRTGDAQGFERAFEDDRRAHRVEERALRRLQDLAGLPPYPSAPGGSG